MFKCVGCYTNWGGRQKKVIIIQKCSGAGSWKWEGCCELIHIFLVYEKVNLDFKEHQVVKILRQWHYWQDMETEGLVGRG